MGRKSVRIGRPGSDGDQYEFRDSQGSRLLRGFVEEFLAVGQT
jgi:hypothetical protein